MDAGTQAIRENELCASIQTTEGETRGSCLVIQFLLELCISPYPISATVSQVAGNPKSFTIKGQNLCLMNILGTDLKTEASGNAKVTVASPTQLVILNSKLYSCITFNPV